MAGEPQDPMVRLLGISQLPPLKPHPIRQESNPSYSTSGHLDPREFTNGRPVWAVICNIINGPFVEGAGSAALADGSSLWRGRVELPSADWHVTLDLRRDNRAVRDELRQSGGFAFTHAARIVRADGQAFNGPGEISASVDALTESLSFARGALVGVALPIGVDAAMRRCWVRWTVGIADAWRGTLSWLDPVRAVDLGDLYARFVALRADSYWQDVLSDAIRYYVHGNEPAPVNLAMVTAQAAFELLAWSILKERTSLLSKAEFKALNAAEKLTRLLQLAGISVDIPASLTAMQSAAAAHGWIDGPQAITRMRNTMTHPTRSRPRFDHDCWLEGWRLSQTYLELLLLRLMDYRGRYMSRLPDASRHAGSSTSPPWR
jgi:hypothetical protein